MIQIALPNIPRAGLRPRVSSKTSSASQTKPKITIDVSSHSPTRRNSVRFSFRSPSLIEASVVYSHHRVRRLLSGNVTDSPSSPSFCALAQHGRALNGMRRASACVQTRKARAFEGSSYSYFGASIGNSSGTYVRATPMRLSAIP
jgi:hypothetical protein